MKNAIVRFSQIFLHVIKISDRKVAQSIHLARTIPHRSLIFLSSIISKKSCWIYIFSEFWNVGYTCTFFLFGWSYASEKPKHKYNVVCKKCAVIEIYPIENLRAGIVKKAHPSYNLYRVYTYHYVLYLFYRRTCSFTCFNRY